MKHTFFIFLISITLLIITTNVHAFRCGDDIVGRWDTVESVYKKCGPPFKTESNKIYYNCGEFDSIYELTIKNNIVVKDDPIHSGTGKSQCNAPNKR